MYSLGAFLQLTTTLLLPFLVRVSSRLASLRLLMVVLACVGNLSPAHRPRVISGQVSFLFLAQPLVPAFFRSPVWQQTSTSLVSEQTCDGQITI